MALLHGAERRQRLRRRSNSSGNKSRASSLGKGGHISCCSALPSFGSSLEPRCLALRRWRCGACPPPPPLCATMQARCCASTWPSSTSSGPSTSPPSGLQVGWGRQRVGRASLDGGWQHTAAAPDS